MREASFDREIRGEWWKLDEDVWGMVNIRQVTSDSLCYCQ